MRVETLTDERVAVLHAVAQHTARRGYPPSLRDLAEAVGLGVTTTSYHVGRLAAGGYVEHTPRLPRTLRLTQAGSAVVA
ncbi:winged helix-turn-helix transcriptional regulator [Longispora sp. NPDC051575]|uniref:LexA family protein n=1 Tax=Longispora sp. NPDC051575 TaxID=3154943 RepID=UPI00341E6E37